MQSICSTFPADSKSRSGGRRFLTTAQLRELFGGCSEMSIWRWRRQFPDFPKPAIVNKRHLYPEDEALAFLESRRLQTEAA